MHFQPRRFVFNNSVGFLYSVRYQSSHKSSHHEEANLARTITKTVNGGVSGALDLTKILHLALDAGFSYSWSTSNAEGSSSSVECPKGSLQCGILVTSYVVKTTGQIRSVYVNEQGQEGCQPATSWNNFEVVAPEIVAPDAPKNQQTKMSFRACLDTCNGKQCDTPEAKSLPWCDQVKEVAKVAEDAEHKAETAVKAAATSSKA